MWKLPALAFVATMAATPLPALAYTQADADACTPDAMRLCMDAVPDEHRVATCLFEKKQQLSPACMAVFNRARDASTTSAPRGAVVKTKF